MESDLLIESADFSCEHLVVSNKPSAIVVGSFSVQTAPASLGISTTEDLHLRFRDQQQQKSKQNHDAILRRLTVTVDGCKVPLERILRSNGRPDMSVDGGAARQQGQLELSTLLGDKKGSRRDLDGVVLRCVQTKQIVLPRYVARFNGEGAMPDDPQKRHFATGKTGRKLFGFGIKHRRAMHKGGARRVVVVPAGAVLETVRLVLN